MEVMTMNPAVLQCGPALDTLGREHVESAPLWPCSHAAPMLLPCCPLAAPLPWLWPAGPGKALSGLGCHLGCHMPAQALTRSRASLTSVRWGTRSRSRRADLIPRHSPYPIPAPTLNRTLTLALALTLALTLTLTPTLTLMLTPWPHSQPSARARRLCEQARNLLLIAVLLFVFFPVAAQNNPALQAAR